MAKQTKLHMKEKLAPGMACPKDGNEMHLVMKLRRGSQRGPMYWTCRQCGHQKLKVKGDL